MVGVVNAVARIAALAACAAVVCPSASAVDPRSLALMPLPRQSLGPDAAALVLAKDSGVASNAAAARDAGGGVTAAALASDGRITGYTLDYALPRLRARRRAQSLLEVQTIAELYRDQSTAMRGLSFWRVVTGALRGTKAGGVTVGLSPFTVHVGNGAFAFELTCRFAGKPVLYVGDVVFRRGDLLGAVFVTVTREAGLRARSVALAHRLAARIEQVTTGKIQKP